MVWYLKDRIGRVDTVVLVLCYFRYGTRLFCRWRGVGGRYGGSVFSGGMKRWDEVGLAMR